MNTLLRSQIKCLADCGEVIASIDRHDFRSCSCGAVAIDGGRDYLRVLGDPHNFEVASLQVNEELLDEDAALALHIYRALWREGDAYIRQVKDRYNADRPESVPAANDEDVMWALNLLEASGAAVEVDHVWKGLVPWGRPE